MNTQSLAYRKGAEAARNGTHISNCYPFTVGDDFENWKAGYESVKANSWTSDMQDMREMTMAIMRSSGEI